MSHVKSCQSAAPDHHKAELERTTQQQKPPRALSCCPVVLVYLPSRETTAQQGTAPHENNERSSTCIPADNPRGWL